MSTHTGNELESPKTPENRIPPPDMFHQPRGTLVYDSPTQQRRTGSVCESDDTLEGKVVQRAMKEALLDFQVRFVFS